MANQVNRLTDAKAKRLTEPGRHADGGGLYLTVTPTGGKKWVFLFTHAGKRREMGLGTFPTVTLAKARTRAREAAGQVADGTDPIAERRRLTAATGGTTFGEAVEAFMADRSPDMKNAKHVAQWHATLVNDARHLTNMPVADVDTDAVMKVLRPIWSTKHETATRVQGRIENVLDYAKVRGWRSGENPAHWKGHLSVLLSPKRKLLRGNHAAMAYADLPAFMDELMAREEMSARALAFLILTAARSGEVRGMVWDEVDLANAIWTVPAARMKAKREHRVPLTDEALAILEERYAERDQTRDGVERGGLVFPGAKAGQPMSDMTMCAVLKRMRRTGVTVHGFRSTFRDWTGDATDVPREVAEAALAHAVGSAVERAYRRGDALEKRRALMERWAEYCVKPPVDGAEESERLVSDEVAGDGADGEGLGPDLADEAVGPSRSRVPELGRAADR